ncbi:hypothetical protein DPM19_30120 [Actinomadura craniellae]|uniref:Tetrapyrrole methylase domain-containing protein n=1 Tax=Actinomadura craniellae TaxID=2231787 RepID=A0A365GXK2_9ACTN|nr:SAM-dependent methyltransferase [Actinomadura craniellae]RAY11559.1 hypothetical protein DPM19_30120 [Actinomadura craniellae]
MSELNSRAGEIDVPWNLIIPEADIYLVGYGMRMPNDFTLEMLAVLKRCQRIFAVPPINAPEFGIPRMENLLHFYAPDKNRHKTYREMLELILDAAAEDAPVALATYGSAMVGTFVAHRILEEAPERGLTVHVTNAVSSFDGIWADLNIEPFYGFEIWEATAFVKLEIQPDPRVNLLLPQAPIFGVAKGPDISRLTMETSSTLVDLRDYLLRFYPPEHRVHFIKTGSGAGPRSVGPAIETLPLAELHRSGRNQGSTLLVPRMDSGEELNFRQPAAATEMPAVAAG